jgi:hypothetical protein
MRLVAGALALILFASVARAEDTRVEAPLAPAADAAPGKLPFRVVRVMAQSHQALLFDRTRATHVLAELGATLDGYTVEAIDEDEVTLRFEGTRIVLAAPPHGGRRHDRDLAARHARPATGVPLADTLPVDPTPGPAPVDPYGEVAIRVASAPGAAGRDAAGHATQVIEAGDGGVRVAEAPGRPALGTPVAEAQPVDLPPAGIRVAEAPAGVAGLSTAGALTPEAKAPDARPASPPPAPSEIRTASAAPADTIVLTRQDVDGALGDFGRLAAGVRGRFSAKGLTVDAVGEATIFQRAGLRAGDVITAVDGARLRSLDDAANLYACASTATTITAQILRGGAPVTLHVAIR